MIDARDSYRVLTALAADGEPVRFRARGGSMWPAIRDGAVVELRPCDASSLRLGDIAAYRRRGRLVVHRLIGRTPGGQLRFAGDAQPTDDADVTADQVLGRVSVVRQPALRPKLPTPRRVKRLLVALRRQVQRVAGARV